MMEESVNEEHAYNNENVTNTSLFHKKKRNVTPPYIISPAMMEDCESMIHINNNENKTENSLDISHPHI